MVMLENFRLLKSHAIKVIIAWTLIGISTHAFCQVSNDENLSSAALSKAFYEYDNYFGKNLSLYTGKQYNDNYGQVGDHQFFMDDYWEQGSVVFEGQFYDSIYLKFDIFKDELLVEYFSDKGLAMTLKLQSTMINSFQLQGHTFIRLQVDSAATMKTGFYDQLFVGANLSLYARRQKEIVRTSGSNTLRDDFVQKDKYFLLKADTYYPVKNRGSVVRVLEDHKKEVKHFIKSNNLRFQTERDRDITIVARYYQSLFQ
ncbi:MAG: hypothetical protein U5K79_20465 [Cyclobacteriaceae bacterium]|nr:hypothetical protein [Cyclobacteriaceae bacterium]